MRYTIAALCLLAACSAPAPGKKLVIYSSAGPDVADYYGQAFTRETGIPIEYVLASTGEIIKRIEVEKDSPIADLQWGGSAEYAARIRGSLEPYRTSNEAAFLDVYKNTSGLFTSITILPNVLLVNTNLYQKPVRGYGDLLDPELRGKIAFADPSLSGSSFEHLVNMLYAMGGGDPEKGWPFVEKFIAHLDGKLLGSSSVLYKGVGGSEYSVGLTVEFGAVEQVRAGSPVRIVYMQEGVTAKNYGVFLVKGGGNSAGAKAFIDFITRKDIQESFARFDSRGVRKDIALPKDSLLPPLASLKLTSPDSALVEERKDAWLNRFKEIYTKK